MNGTDIIPRDFHFPVLYKKPETKLVANVRYERIDSAHYEFSYDFDESCSFRMHESEQTVDHTDFVNAEYDASVPESDKIYYALAAAGGIITGSLSTIRLSEDKLNKIKEFKEKDWKALILNVSSLAGYKGRNYKTAASFLLKKAAHIVQGNDKAKESLTVLSSHPSLAGLLFSIVKQFSGMEILISESGDITVHKLPAYYTIGDTKEEKITYAFFYWLFALGRAEAASRRRVLDGSGLPRDLVNVIKEFTGLPFMQMLCADNETAEMAFSAWLRPIVEGAAGRRSNSGDSGANPLFAMMGVALDLAGQSIPVLINECIVTGLYILLRTCAIVKERGIQTAEEFGEVKLSEVFPSNDRLYSGMCLVASATFAGANIAGATIHALMGQKRGNEKFLEAFLEEINIVGIGRFILACANDSKYWGDGIRISFRRFFRENTANADTGSAFEADNEAFAAMKLEPPAAKALYNLEYFAVKYDIEHTQKEPARKAKQLWLDTWKEALLDRLQEIYGRKDEFIAQSDEEIYDGLYRAAKDKEQWKWIYRVALELALFKPYTAVGTEQDAEFRKLKWESDYVRNEFVRRQTIVSQDEVDAIIKTYKKYKAYIGGTTQKAIIGTGIAAVATAAAGGAAFVFAPGIAVVIAGEAVAGLHGAALVNASLAFVGGGAIAAGGLGVAGGTAIITGGGALIGLAGSGAASAAMIMLQSDSEFWIHQGAMLLTYCDCILNNKFKDRESVQAIAGAIDRAFRIGKDELAAIKADKNDLDKELIHKTEENLKYLEKWSRALKAILS